MPNHRHGSSWMIPIALLLPLFSATSADYRSGMDHYSSGDYASAAEEFRALIDVSPEYDFGYYMLGLCLLREQASDAAIASLRRAIELDQGQFKYRLGLGQAQIRAGDYTGAAETLDNAESLIDDEVEFDFYSNRGYALAALKRWPEAVRDLEHADRVRPDQAAVVGRLGVGYFYSKEYERAISTLRRAGRMSSDTETHDWLLAEALLRATPGDPEIRARHYSEAVSVAERLLADHPNDLEAAYLLGRAALGAGDYDRAAESIERFLAGRPDHCFAWLNLSRARMALGRWNDAGESLTQAIECDDEMLPAHLSLGLVYRVQGELERSLAVYERAYDRWPSVALQKSIEDVRHNIAVRVHNAGVEEQARKDATVQEELDRQRQELLDRIEIWTKSTRDD